ncbi:hypothetical protein HU200_015296 [Digitaria exilis]|uniref:Retrotransposon gag domain-containing protein n=1 Tax=Digitaria exilis TaxID=1010633 RepID=A0A835KM29_9POAL|nr:hypothetical protein HU200_015296 [Digitaria exilis]
MRRELLNPIVAIGSFSPTLSSRAGSTSPRSDDEWLHVVRHRQYVYYDMDNCTMRIVIKDRRSFYYVRPQQRPTTTTPPQRPSRSRWTTTLEAGMSVTFEARQPGSRETFTLEPAVSVAFEARRPGSRETFTLEPAFPSRSRLGKLELAGQARACHAGSNARDSATITTNHNDSPLRSKRRIHCATPPPILRRRHRSNPPGTVDSDLTLHSANHSFDFACLRCAIILDGNPRRRLRRLDPDAVLKWPPSKHHINRCHAVSRSWEARFPLTSCAAWVAQCTQQRQHHERMYSHALPLMSIKGEGKPMQTAANDTSNSGTWEFVSFSHLACNPLLRATRNRCSAPLLDVRPRGRNQDKNSRLFTRHRGNEWISTAITCLCRCDQIKHRHAAQLSFPMANFSQGRPPLGESNLLPPGQEIRHVATVTTCASSGRNRATSWSHLNCHWQHRDDGVVPDLARAADVSIPPPAREGEIPPSGSQERAAPFLPGSISAPRATTARPYPYGLRGPTATYASLVRTAMSAYDGQPGRHPASGRDLTTLTPDDSHTESEDGYAFEHEHLGWDCSGLRDPEAFLAFQTAADYCFGYSDDEYDPTRECFVISDGRVNEGSTSDHDGEDDDHRGNNGTDPVGAQPPDPSDHLPFEDERHPCRRPRVVRPHDLGSGDVSPPARSDHEPPKQGHEHSTDARRAGRVAQARILAEGKDDDLAPRTSQKLIAAAALLRAMPEAATPEGRKLHLEAQKLVENAARQQAESSASRLRRSSASKGERGGESSVRSPRPNGRARVQSRGDSHRDMARRHVGEPCAPEAGTLPARVPTRSRLRDTRGAINDGDARNTLNQMRQREGTWAHQRGRNDVGWNRDAAPEPVGTRVFSRNIRTAPIPPRFRQPTTITKYSGETDPRVWLNYYRLAICPPNRIRDWNDLVETFVGNFQGTYVRPGNTWDLRGCKQKPGESLRDFIRRFSKRCTELPNITDHQIIHFFLESTTSYNLICKLGRNPPPDANRLFEVASKYASGEEAANAIFNGKKGKRPEETPAEGSKPRYPSKKRATTANEVPTMDPSHKGPRGPPCGGVSLMPTDTPRWNKCSSSWEDPPPTEVLANAWNIQQLMPAYTLRLRQHLTSLRLMATSFRGACIGHNVIPAAVIFAREEDALPPTSSHTTPEKARPLPHEVAVTALMVIMTPHEAVEGTWRECSRHPPSKGGSHRSTDQGFETWPIEGSTGTPDRSSQGRSAVPTNKSLEPICSRRSVKRVRGWSKVPTSRDPTRGSIEPSTSIERGRGMDVRSNYPLPAHPGIRGTIPIVGSTDRLILDPSKETTRYEQSSTFPRTTSNKARFEDLRRCGWTHPWGSNKNPSHRAETLRECQPLSQGLEGYTRGTREGTKASEASTNTNLHRIEPHSCGGSGATVGYQYPAKAHHNNSSSASVPLEVDDHPRSGNVSRLEGDVHPRASVSVAFEARQPGSRETFTLEPAFPLRSRLGGQARGIRSPSSQRFRHVRGLASSSLRAKLEPATPGATPETLRPSPPIIMTLLCGQKEGFTAPRHRPYCGEDIGQIHLARDTVPTTPLTLLASDALSSSMATLKGDYGGSIRTPCSTVMREASHQPLPCRQPELGGAIPDHICTQQRQHHERMYSHALPLMSIKGEGKPMQTAANDTSNSGTWEFVSFSHLACNRLLRATRNRCSAPLLDVRPRGRNQDKNSRLFTRHRGNKWISTAITSMGSLLLLAISVAPGPMPPTSSRLRCASRRMPRYPTQAPPCLAPSSSEKKAPDAAALLYVDASSPATQRTLP